MENETKRNSEVPAMEVAESIPVNGEKKESEDASFDGEFIKIEKESYEPKETSKPIEENNKAENSELSIADRSAGHPSPSKEMLEAIEKSKELEFEVDRIAKSLKESDLENAKLREELFVMKAKCEESGNSYEELQINHKKLQDQTLAAEQEFSSQLKSLQEKLEEQASKHQELSGVKEVLDNLNLELEDSKMKMQHLEQELEMSLSERKKFEELHKESSLHAESNSQKVEDLERLLEAAKLGAKEAEDRMTSLQEDIIGLQAKIAENEKLDELFKSNSMELSSKNKLIDEMSQELEQIKVSEQQLKEDKLALEAQFSTSKDDLQNSILELEDMRLRLKEEVAAKESAEGALRSQQEAVSKSQDELAIVVAEKERLKSDVADLSGNLEQMENQCANLEEKVRSAEENYQMADGLSAISRAKNAELEQKLNALQELYDESKDSTEKKLQLEASLQAANASLSERELLLDTQQNRIKELEEEVEAMSKKIGDADTVSKDYSDKLSELEVELDKLCSAKESLEKELKMASEREKALVDSLNLATEEKRTLEDSFQNSSAKLQESESLLEVLRNDQNLMQVKLESLENDLNASLLREGEVKEKLEEQKSLAEKLQLLEEQIKIHKETLAEADVKAASFADELNRSSEKMASLNNSNEELKSALALAEEKVAQSFSENKALLGMNSQLEKKVGELENLLESANAERETASQQIASHLSKITDLTDQHTRSYEAKTETEARIVQLEAQLKETVDQLRLKETEVERLMEQQNATNKKVELLEEEVREASGSAESRKSELDQTLVKLEHQAKTIEELDARSGQLEADNGALAEANIKLNEELAGYESKLNVLQAELSGLMTEKDEAVELCNSSKKIIEDLTHQLASETENLQSKISSMTEEHTHYREANEETWGDLQAELTELKGKLKEYEEASEVSKLEMEKMTAVAGEKSEIQARAKQLEERLLVAESQLKEEAESAEAKDALNKKVLELQEELGVAQSTITRMKEESSKHFTEELEAKSHKIVLLEKQIKELEHKIQLESSTSKETVEVKSRDIGGSSSSPSKRKSKKSGSSSPLISSSESHAATAQASSSAMNIKLVLGVALFSIILGIILGKRY